MEAWIREDSITAYGDKLTGAGIARPDLLGEIRDEAGDLLTHILRLTINDEVSPRLDLVSDPDGIGKMMFSNQSLDKMEEGKPEVLIPLGENPRVRSLRNKERFYKDKEGKAVSKAKLFQLRDGIFEAVIDPFYKDG